jgi:hypothetical protein
MRSSGSKNLILDNGEVHAFTDKLTRLLNLSSFERTSKIEQLKGDHPSVFYDAKIITDIRPVFDLPGDPPVGAIIGHTLKVVCHDHGGDHKELYFALDSEDVESLKKIAERAQQKASSLKALINSVQLADFS